MDRRPSSWRWASAASARGNSPPTRTRNSPEATQPSTTPALQGCEQHEKVAHPVAFVFIIIRARRSGAGWTAQPGLLHLLFAGLVQAHQDLVVPVLAMVDLQHILHGAHEFGTALGRDAPALFQPGLEFVFFSVWRTVSVLMLSTISHSTSWSASSRRVQPARPSGGWEQVRAIS